MATNNSDANKSLDQTAADKSNEAANGKTSNEKDKKDSALLAASKGRSAVDHVMANSSGDVKGTNGLANTGPVTSYENED